MCIATWLAAAGYLPVFAQSHPGVQAHQLFPITADQVALAISGKGVPIEVTQVSLLADVVAGDPRPQLDILSVGAFGEPTSGKSLVKLACHEPRACLPFYAVVTEMPADKGSNLSKATSTVAALKADSIIVVHAGSRAMLVMDDDRTHIRIAVVALENGAAGHTIRVASPDHKQFYSAEVVSPNLLRRSF